MKLESGTTLLHYRLIEKIGEGGMGVVWRAADAKLGREVAIKILPEGFARNADRLARFEREAKLLASLNHAGIAAIHGLEEADVLRFLVLELVPGRTLEERLRAGPLPMDEALDYCCQIAEGLEAAHGRGVVHRDLKPGNVKVTPDGRVKILDFGLAKDLTETETGKKVDLTESPTVTTPQTGHGSITGTAPYMSPEQARGKPVDRRTDIWALGCVLYEALTGSRTFPGESMPECLASVLTAEPDWTKLPRNTHSVVRWLLERSLRKDPNRRLRDAGDARVFLQEALENPVDEHSLDATPPPPSSRLRRALPWCLAAAMAIIAALAFWYGGRSPSTGPAHPMRLSVTLPEGIRLGSSIEQPVMAISPDGRTLAYLAEREGEQSIYIRRLDYPEAIPLAGTERANTPFFSPDGLWLGFFAEGKLKKVSLQGGEPIPVADAGLSRGACWGEDGTIVYSPATNSGLMRVPAGGGPPEPLTQLDEARHERTHRWPECLPGGRAVLFTVGTLNKPGDYADSEIGAFFPETGERRALLRGASMVRYAAPGQLILARRGVLSAVPFDADRVAVGGTPVTLLKRVTEAAASGAAFFGVSRTGTLAFVEHDPRGNEHTLAWFDRQGKAAPLSLPPREYRSPRISPDGTRVALAIGPGMGGESDIWILDLGAEALTRLTFDNTSWTPIWSPDGTYVAYSTVSADAFVVSRRRADGSGVEERLSQSPQDAGTPQSFSADGTFLLFQGSGGKTSSNIWLLPMDDLERSRPIVSSPAVEWNAALSPDGRWLAYTSDETGQPEVYVQGFPGPGGRWQVSQDRGTDPIWSRDGTELFYLRDNRTFFTVPVRLQPTFSQGKPRELFSTTVVATPELTASFDVAADGQRFLVVLPARRDTQSHRVDLLLDWPAMLRRLKGGDEGGS